MKIKDIFYIIIFGIGIYGLMFTFIQTKDFGWKILLPIFLVSLFLILSGYRRMFKEKLKEEEKISKEYKCEHPDYPRWE